MCLTVFSRLESRMSADIGAIMQLMQRQIPMIPPSYSTLTSSTPNTPHSPIQCCSAIFPTDKSADADTQQSQSTANRDQLPGSHSLDSGSSVRFTSPSPLIQTLPVHTISSHTSPLASLSLLLNNSTSLALPQTSTQTSSSSVCASTCYSLPLPSTLATITPQLPESLNQPAPSARTSGLDSELQVLLALNLLIKWSGNITAV